MRRNVLLLALLIQYLAQPITVQGTLEFGEFLQRCAHGCTDNGNCNGETGLCECPFGYAGPTCNLRLFPACHTSLQRHHTPPQYGMVTHKNCLCYAQLATVGLESFPGERNVECLFPALCHTDLLCFKQLGVLPALQTSDIPAGGFSDPSLEWFIGQPHVAETLKPTLAPTDNVIYGQMHQLPLALCPQRCSESGFCYNTTKDPQPTCYCNIWYNGTACDHSVNTECYLGCGEGGRCLGGFCHCTPGRWGLGCSRDKAYISSKGHMPDHVDMKVYVYDIPTHVVPSPKVNDDGWGYSDPMYDAEYRFTAELLQDWSIRTQNPWEANLFFLSLSTYNYSGNTNDPKWIVRRAVNYVRSLYPFWNETNGRNHIVWAVNDRGLCQFWHYEAALQNPIKMVHFGQAPVYPYANPLDPHTFSDYAYHLRHAVFKNGEAPLFKGFSNFTEMDFGKELDPCYKPEKDIVAVPGIAQVSGWPWSTFIALAYGSNQTEFRRDNNTLRNITLFFAGGVRSEQAYSQGVRQALRNMFGEGWTNSNRTDFVVTGNVGNMLKSKFCLAPTGEGWGIRVVQALHSGCIPVIVQDRIYQYLWDVLPYHAFSVRISRRNLHRLPEILDRITPQQLERLQAGAVKWHRAFSYDHAVGGMAYNFTIKALRRRLTNLWGAHYRH